jgi:16S rRNA processing protein RimM
VLSPHGVRGELKCRVITDFPKQRFKRGNTVLIRSAPFTIRSARVQGANVLLGLTEIGDRTAAETFRGADIEVPTTDAVSLPRGQFYWHEVIGLRVIDVTTQEDLGTVADIIETGANDVYVVKGARGEVLIPAIKDVIETIDPEAGEMRVRPLEGMLPSPRKQSDQAAPVSHARRRPKTH